jgi:polyisoprenoid-binding protein YceI
MQEHFNEKYVESPQFPKAKFKGSIADFAKLKLTETPTEVTVTGDMTLHGVTKQVTIKGTLAKKSNKIIAVSKFMIVPEEYDIKIPGAVRENIAKEIEVTVNATYDLINK